MSPENIAYMARVNAAYHLVRNARKVSRRLADTTSEQQQAIEHEIAVIGMRLYSETCEEKQPEATYHPGEDHELEDYIAAVRELVPDAERSIIVKWKRYGLTAETAAKKWRSLYGIPERSGEQ